MSHPPPKQSSNPAPLPGAQGRAVGLDIHPDTFAAAILDGRDALRARLVASITRQPLAALGAWAARHTTAEDILILEASANSFAIAERLTALGRQVFILESHRAGQISQSYLANDKVDAAKIARIYLSGLAIKVWQPDAETRQRRALLSSYQRCVKDSTRSQQHLRSYLNEHALRLPKGFRLCRPEALPRLVGLKDWSPRQKLLLGEMHGSLLAARQRRSRLRRMMALEIEETPDILRLYKLAGLNLVTTEAAAPGTSGGRKTGEQTTRSEAHWAQPCVRLGAFTGYASPSKDIDDYLPKCFIFLDGKLERMPVHEWAKTARYTPGQVWCPAGVPRTDVNPRPLSPLVPSCGLIGCLSGDENLVWATAWEPYQELFQGVARCLHSDFRIGGLDAGQVGRGAFPHLPGQPQEHVLRVGRIRPRRRTDLPPVPLPPVSSGVRRRAIGNVRATQARAG
jgi:hypothetical protein